MRVRLSTEHGRWRYVCTVTHVRNLQAMLKPLGNLAEHCRG